MKKGFAILLSALLFVSFSVPLSAAQDPTAPTQAATALQKQTASGKTDFAGAYKEMNNPQFWISQLENPDQVLMTPQEIAAFSKTVLSTPGTNCVDLDAYPQTLTQGELLERIRTYGTPSGQRYLGDKALDEAYYTTLFQNRNEAAVRDINAVRFGVIVKNAQLRTYPTWDVSYGAPNDTEFDLNCETVLKVAERVAVLHESADSNWYLVQSYNYIGWVQAADIALAERETWRELEHGAFIVVTENHVALETASDGTVLREVTLGTRLPQLEPQTHGFARVAFPTRRADGTLELIPTDIPTNMVSAGYLPYTQRNVIELAFKMLGDRYGWSGLWNSRDCSSFIMDIYQCFGINLPRNANHQAAVLGLRTDTSQMSAADKAALILGSPAGTMLEMRGHIMLYLGDYNGKPYAIHAVYSFLPHGSTQVKYANRVLVSDLDIRRTNNQTFLDAIRVVNTIQTKPPAQ